MRVLYDLNQTSSAIFVQVLKKMGFLVSFEPEKQTEVTIQVEGMKCNSCVKKIEGCVLEKNGVFSVQVIFIRLYWHCPLFTSVDFLT